VGSPATCPPGIVAVFAKTSQHEDRHGCDAIFMMVADFSSDAAP
jgi:hypothetical protein